MTPSGDIKDITVLAPAISVCEDSFAALGRGAIVQTDTGPVAVEDLLPGDKVKTAGNGYQTLLWRGAMQIIPGAQNTRAEMGTMTRVTSDTFGYAAPSPDLVLGPAARILHRHPDVKTLTGKTAAFVPARDFIDGETIVELTTVAPVNVYQLGFEQHERISVNGVEVETLHPGLPHTLPVKHEMLSVLMSLFPHKDSIHSFGPLCQPRIRLRDLDLFQAA